MNKLTFYNSLTRRKEKFVPINSEHVNFYTCGPTVYNFAHIGNFRAYIFEDILRRTLKFNGYNVVQIMNLTDVDDKTIRDSQAEGKKLKDFTEKYKKAFFEDLNTLNIEKAEFYPAATDHITEMIELIKKLFDNGFAYKANDGSVYFSINKFKDYGKLAKIDMENQIAGARISSDEYEKDSVADFALWKARDEADGDVRWKSPWGEGRPGWHIECSAMSMKYLGESFDIHTGGIDNMFPHHEDEIAQSEGATGKKFVNYWLHNDYLIVNNEKMSKSLGNFFTIRDLLKKGIKGEEIRFVLMSIHYRKKLNFTIEACQQARQTLSKFRELFAKLAEIDTEGELAESTSNFLKNSKEKFTDAVNDDLNMAKALAELYALQRFSNKKIGSSELNRNEAEEILALFRNFDQILGTLKVKEFAKPAEKNDVPEEIFNLLKKRDSARKEKDFATADEIRDKLSADGWIVKDGPEGSKVQKI